MNNIVYSCLLINWTGKRDKIKYIRNNASLDQTLFPYNNKVRYSFLISRLHTLIQENNIILELIFFSIPYFYPSKAYTIQKNLPFTSLKYCIMFSTHPNIYSSISTIIFLAFMT